MCLRLYIYVIPVHFIWILATYDVVRHVRCRTPRSCTYDIVRHGVTYDSDIVLNIARTSIWNRDRLYEIMDFGTYMYVLVCTAISCEVSFQSANVQ